MMDFNEITQAMLEDYEKQYFDVINVPIKRGVVRQAEANVKVGIAAGWINEPFKGFSDNGWKAELPDPEKLQILRDASDEIDKKYSGFVNIDPSG